MEIVRNSRDAKVLSPAVKDVSEIKRLRIRNGSWGLEAVYDFGDGAPEASNVEERSLKVERRYVDRQTGDLYAFNYPDTEWVLDVESWFDTDMLAAPVDPYFTRYCGKFEVSWTYVVPGSMGGDHVDSQQHVVYEPLFTPDELKVFDEDFERKNVSDAAINRLERIVRAVIERSTGQKFELSYGTVTARSYNGASLVVPKRVVSLEGSSGMINGVSCTVESDGWLIMARKPHRNIHILDANPIYDVYTTTGFKEEHYTLRGEWGYTSIPEQIKLAAMLLAQDYGCRESVWRDRYIEMMKNVDWSIQYHSGAFQGTGNIKVDQILQSYILNKMVVV